ncbi:hypothetical protein ACQKM9_04830 [Viridibacillus sp. NPDC093762]|uniref:hypothetical protein n=1 Tax=Viridibacillus sp. NPDC093762 TaxID=3390720 RepID=UPI003CFE02AD
MIELEITQKILDLHEGWVFGENASNEERLYKQFEKLTDNESDLDIKNIYLHLRKKFKEIILGDLNTLNNIIFEYEKMMGKFRLNDNEEIKKVRGRDRWIGKKERRMLLEMKEIFEGEYKYFYSSTNWNAYLFLNELNISICPYCSSQFIFLYNDKGKKTRATLDHFFDKATYPFLSVSIFNLVPACKVCNSDLKSTKEFTLKKNYSPYEKKIADKIEFVIDVTNVKKSKKIENKNSEIDYYEMFVGNSTEFDIKINVNPVDILKETKIKGNIKDFGIEKFYNKYHKNYVKSIIRKSHIYNKVYLSTLLNTFDLVFINEEDLLSAIYPRVEDDKNFMLGKLTRDIAKKQLEFLNK